MRQKEVASAVAHYIAGVFAREPMASILDDLCRTAAFQPGDRVKTLRGSMRGIITRVLDDGRVAVRPDGGATDLIAPPESLCPDE